MNARNKLVYGVGVNDSDYVTKKRINGKQVCCPIFRKWQSMLERCYCPKYHAKQPTYIDCTVAPEWRSFMTFKAWMITQDWAGKELDKDIIKKGNKVYSSSFCLFVDKNTNSLLNEMKATRGAYPIGVNIEKRNGTFKSQVSFRNDTKNLGSYSTPEAAHLAYRKVKAAIVQLTAYKQKDSRVKEALLQRAYSIGALGDLT